jgi:hypothetical protein
MSTLTEPRILPGIDRRENLSLKEFEREYLLPLRPVVITDALKAWKPLGRWTPDFFQQKFGDRLVNIDGAKRPLGPFLDEVLASTADHPAPYLRNEILKDVFPELADEIHPLPPYLQLNWLTQSFSPAETKILQRLSAAEIYIGGAGRSFPVVHFDYLHTNAFLMQLHGRKQYYVAGPDQTPFMYPVPNDPNRSQVNDVLDPDLERFPLFAKAEGHSFTLDARETLFIPSGWWHTVRILSPSITVSVNTANRANWGKLRADFCRIHVHGRGRKLLLGAYLQLVGIMSSMSEAFGGTR